MIESHVCRLREIAAELVAIAAELAAACEVPVPPPQPRAGRLDRMLDTATAAKRFRLSYSSLYRLGRSHGCGWKTQSGTWKFSQNRLREAVDGGEPGEFGDTARLPMAKQIPDTELGINKEPA